MDGNTPDVIPVPDLEELGIGASDDLVLLGDPFVFAVEINTDADADQRPGIQVVISVDLSSQEGLDDLTPDQLVYAKYYTQAAIDAAIAKLEGRKEMTYDQAIAEGFKDYLGYLLKMIIRIMI